MNKPFPWEIFTSETTDQLTSDNYSLGANLPDGRKLSTPVVSLLKKYSLIEIKGSDAEKFMQGQFTCDVTMLTSDHSGLGACCNNKGRMLGLFKIARIADDHFLLRLPADVAVSLVEHLSKYKAFYSCSCNINSQWACIAYFGDDSAVDEILPNLPQEPHQQIVANGAIVIRSGAGGKHLEIWLDSEQGKDISKKLVSTCRIAPENLWNLAEIHTGTGEIYTETLAEFIPQMFNLQILGAISFKKGCYTGQEIVARMQYLGKLKKRLFLLAIDGVQAKITDHVYCNNSKLGSIVRVEQQSAKSQLALAVLDGQAESLEDKLWLGEEQAIEIKLQALPYVIPEQDNQPLKDQ